MHVFASGQFLDGRVQFLSHGKTRLKRPPARAEQRGRPHRRLWQAVDWSVCFVECARVKAFVALGSVGTDELYLLNAGVRGDGAIEGWTFTPCSPSSMA